MEVTPASTLQKKKITKAKLKKTIKNVLCRPDPVFWPLVNEAQKQQVERALSKYRVQIPEFQKPLWKDLKSVPKEQRPKPPKIEKVEGLIFGISECSETVQRGQCSGIIIEASVNPRTIVEPLIESCIDKRIPLVCIEGLRQITKAMFGIQTSCLGSKNCLTEICSVIKELAGNKLPQKKIDQSVIQNKAMVDVNTSVIPMDTQESIAFEYLYRTNKKNRVFVPPLQETINNLDKNFKGQDFIEFSNKIEQAGKKGGNFKKMIVKRISSNPNRTKVK